MTIHEGFVESAGHRLAYLAANEELARDDQPCIVFIHGVLASINFWRDCMPDSIKHGRTWYSLSLPAHSPSTVPGDFAPEQVDDEWFFRVMNGALKTLLGKRKAIIVGHSTGGFIALSLAIHQAPNVAGIVSVAGFHSGRWSGVEGLLVHLAGLGRWAKPAFVSNVALGQKLPLIQRLFASRLAKDSRAYLKSPISQRMMDNIASDTREQDQTALFPLFNGISRLEIADQLNRITMPCHLFAGTHDPVVPAKQSLLLASRIQHAKTTVFQNIGHMPFMEAPEAYAEALDQAVANIDAQQRSSTNKNPQQDAAA